MPFNFDSYLGVHEPALHLQARRAQVLASNLANTDTPGYKSQDIDFRSHLKSFDKAQLPADRLLQTSPMHMDSGNYAGGYELKYRIPYQPSLDGNTVEQQVEMSAFSDNAMRYLMSLRIVSGKLNTLSTAIRGQ